MKRFTMTLIMALCLASTVIAVEKTALVTNAEGEPLPSVSITTNLPTVGAQTDRNGRFVLTLSDEVRWVTFSSIGYKSRQFEADKIPDKIVLELAYYEEEPIIVRADRAQKGLSPIAFDNISQDEIRRDYSVGEFPLLLESTPNLQTYTDGGSALGYSYVKIRGFDDKRIATYINGVPLNDPEDQATYFVDLPDFASNISDIQVQRGVGNSLYGDASFGGSINVVTSAFSNQRSVSYVSGYGQYLDNGKAISDIYRQSIDYKSGLIDGRWSFAGRFSKQKTGGYRENSWYKGWAYYLSMARLDPKMSTELLIYGGPIRMHLSYWGSDLDDIRKNRRDNPLKYNNETDNFNQPHYQLHNVYKLSDKMTLSNTVYYIRGRGYYEQLKELNKNKEDGPVGFTEYGLDTSMIAVDTADLVRQQWVEKSQYGWNPRLDIDHANGQFSLGSSVYYFESDHWGQVSWIEGLIDQSVASSRYRYYQYYGKKWVGSFYASEFYNLTEKLSVQTTAQLRYQTYNFDQERIGAFVGHKYDLDWLFFSPRIGLNYAQSDKLSFFSNFAVSSRTPTDAALYDANNPFVLPSLNVLSVNSDSTVYRFGDPTALSERVYNLEAGGSYRHQKYALSLNLFYMSFRDEILPYGGLDDEGVAITTNADRSVHSGIEFSGKVVTSDWLTLDGNFSYNYNRIKTFAPDIDGFTVDFADKVVPGFPEYLGNLILDVKLKDVNLTLRNRFLGKQYMELVNIDSLAIDNYYVASLSVSYSPGSLMDMGKMTFDLRVDNLFDREYITSGYGGNFAWDGGAGQPVVGGWAQYYVAAKRSFYVQLRLELM